MNSVKKPKLSSKKSGPSLREFQENFVEELKRIDQPARPEIWSSIRSDRFSRKFRLEIYKHAVNGKNLAGLSGTFASTLSFLTKSKAEQIITEFSKQFPSETYDANDTFEKFSTFLRTQPLVKSLPFLPALAKLEFEMKNAPYHRDPLNSDLIGNGERLKTFLLIRDCTFLKSEWTFFDVNGSLLADPKRRRQLIAVVPMEDELGFFYLNTSEWKWLSMLFPEKFSDFPLQEKVHQKSLKASEQIKIYRSLIRKGVLVERQRIRK